MGRVGHLEVEGKVLIVLVVPPGQNDEYCGEFPVALVDATENVNESNGSCGTYSWALRSLMERMWMWL